MTLADRSGDLEDPNMHICIFLNSEIISVIYNSF